MAAHSSGLQPSIYTPGLTIEYRKPGVRAHTAYGNSRSWKKIECRSHALMPGRREHHIVHTVRSA
ncbi:hypothetical protein [Streptomyces albogriseolus]|uniref:hypothetical protein n=1 Tax=Streptomyces albogriseolus TaxID=1887 RepID=UPI00345F4D1C